MFVIKFNLIENSQSLKLTQSLTNHDIGECQIISLQNIGEYSIF